MEFYRADPVPATSWRTAVLMGANSRTYKFALGKALLEVASTGADDVSLGELAVPYAMSLIEHAERFPQGPASAVQSDNDFLSILRAETPESKATGRPSERLISAAARSMPEMVMQKFHNIRGAGRVEHAFYRVSGRGQGARVELTPELTALASNSRQLDEELESRWSIVEASFDAEIGRSLIGEGFALSDDGTMLIARRKRVSIARLRPAIEGFQHGRCFYCNDPIANSPVHIDHVYPFSLMATQLWAEGPDLNGVWNLVVACPACNLDKSNRRPTEAEVRKLIARNERILGSPHPLRRTLELVLGRSERARLGFISAVDELAQFRSA
jgi:5-methylcytosine-specific restriction endonuclease McrA